VDWPVGGWLPHPAADGPFLDEPASNGHPFSDDPALNEPSLVSFTSETRSGRPRLDYVDARLVSSGGIRVVRRAVGRAARRCTRAGRRPGAHTARRSWYHRRRVGRASGLIGRWRVIPHLAPVNGEAARTSAIHWAKTAMAATLRLIPITERARPKSMAGYTGAIVRFVSNAVIATRAPAAAPKRS